MKKRHVRELKIYEALGVKQFRKMAFGLRDMTAHRRYKDLSKEERRRRLYETASNYNFGRVKSLEDVERFKGELLFNASVHAVAGGACLGILVAQIADGNPNTASLIVNGVCTVINGYCVMLQRYNQIRINDLIKKMTPKYLKQKNEERAAIREIDKSLPEGHRFKVIDKKKNTEDITIDELIENASLSELQDLRDQLDALRNESEDLIDRAKKAKEAGENVVQSTSLIGFLPDSKRLRMEFNPLKGATK